MIINDVSTVDLKSYKRLFTFGCSFTGYMWPTWADVLHKEMPNAEFYNLAKSGAGQSFILSMVVEANQRYKFNKDDLIIIQWSTFFREDRYVNNWWHTPGNIFTQSMYDEKFIKQFADLRGYIIRDLAIMTAAKHILEALPSSGIVLTSIPVNAELTIIDPDMKINDVLELYADTIASLQTPMTEVLRPPGNQSVFPWATDLGCYDTENGNPKQWVIDYHPGPVLYYEYLQKLNFPVTEVSKQFAIESENHIRTLKTKLELRSWHRSEHPKTKIL